MSSSPPPGSRIGPLLGRAAPWRRAPTKGCGPGRDRPGAGGVLGRRRRPAGGSRGGTTVARRVRCGKDAASVRVLAAQGVWTRDHFGGGAPRGRGGRRLDRKRG